MEEKLSGKQPCLLISFVVDNGPSMDDVRLQTLTDALARFAAEKREVCVEWEVLCFDGFSPTVIKAFHDDGLSTVPTRRFPLLGRTVLAAADRLLARANTLREAGEQLYRPWMFLLSDGFTVDSMTQAAKRLDEMERAGELLYLPFKLTPRLSTDRLQCLDRNKHIVEIKEGGIDDFFHFVQRMIEQRGTLSIDVGMKFNKSDFEGWAVL